MTMSSSAIRSSIEKSPWSATISVRRSSPKPWASSPSSSLRIFMRRGLDPRISLHSLMKRRTSFSSSSSLVISRAVSRARRMLRISADCFSESLKRLRSAASADGVSFDFLMMRITSSMLSTAILRPSRMCSRSCARFSSNSVRRTITTWRCSTKWNRISLRSNSFDTPSTSASMIAPKVVCIWVCAYSWFSTTIGMTSTFGAIMLALVDGVPKELDLKEILFHFIEHRHLVIVRRTEFELKRAQDREHILEGLKIAVDNIDEVIKIIKKSKDTPSADAALRKRFKLSEKQSAEILNMRLARLTALEITKLDEELREVRKFIKECKEILGSKPRRLKILKEELSELAQGFGDERRTEIVADQGEFSIEDLIAEEDMVITVSHAGYIKRLPVSAYRRQRRGGRGVISAHTKEDDWVEHLFIASTHDYVMFFTQQGQCYWLKVHEIPQAARAARGKPIISCIAMKPDERLASLVPVREFSEDQFLLFATKHGVVKKTRLSEFGNPRSVGIRAINIEKGDELIDVQVTDGRNDIVLATHHGMSIRFHEKDVRDMGRTATGVKGIELDKKDQVIDMVVVRRKSTLLTVTEKGMGKRSELDEYRIQHRGGRGIITLKRADKTGNIVALKEVLPDDELMMITKKGIMIRVPVEGIRISGRNTQGVKVMNLTPCDLVVDVARVVKEDEEEVEDDEDETPPPAPKAKAKAKAKAKK